MVTRSKPVKRPTAGPGRNGHPAVRKPRKTTTPPAGRQVEKFHGVLQDFNFSPKGVVEGFLLQTDAGTIQVNVTADIGFAVVRGMGQTVEAVVEPESTKARRSGHPVYHLVALHTAEGKPLIFAEPGNAEDVTVQGTVKRLNYSKNGAADGAILGSGDFVYLKPSGMKHCALKVGDAVTAEGSATRTPLGQRLIKATTLNGKAIKS